MPAQPLRNCRSWKDHIAAGLSNHPITVASSDLWMSCGKGSPLRQFDASYRPATKYLIGVHLGTAGFRIIQITPSQDADAPNWRRINECFQTLRCSFHELPIVGVSRVIG